MHDLMCVTVHNVPWLYLNSLSSFYYKNRIFTLFLEQVIMWLTIKKNKVFFYLNRKRYQRHQSFFSYQFYRNHFTFVILYIKTPSVHIFCIDLNVSFLVQGPPMLEDFHSPQYMSSNTDLESLGRTPPAARHATRNKHKGWSHNKTLMAYPKGLFSVYRDFVKGFPEIFADG